MTDTKIQSGNNISFLLMQKTMVAMTKPGREGASSMRGNLNLHVTRRCMYRGQIRIEKDARTVERIP